MKVEQTLTGLKKEYNKIQIPPFLKDEGWSDVFNKLDEKKVDFNNSLFPLGRTIVFACLLALIISTVTTVALSSTPGDKLYHLKIASENLKAKISGDENQILKNRVDEIIDLSNSDKNLDLAVEEFKKTIERRQKELENSSESEKENLRQTLQEQEEKLNRAHEVNQNEKLNEAAKKAEEAQGEVKGEEDRLEEDDNNESNDDYEDNNGGSQKSNKRN